MFKLDYKRLSRLHRSSFSIGFTLWMLFLVLLLAAQVMYILGVPSPWPLVAAGLAVTSLFLAPISAFVISWLRDRAKRRLDEKFRATVAKAFTEALSQAEHKKVEKAYGPASH